MLLFFGWLVGGILLYFFSILYGSVEIIHPVLFVLFVILLLVVVFWEKAKRCWWILLVLMGMMVFFSVGVLEFQISKTCSINVKSIPLARCECAGLRQFVGWDSRCIGRRTDCVRFEYNKTGKLEPPVEVPIECEELNHFHIDFPY